MKPAGHTAVMADRARGEVEADSAQVALWRALEFFPTPPWAARAGGELINAIDPPPEGQRWWAWEPACGEGHMAHGLADYFERVHATDIHDHGWDGQHGEPADFLALDDSHDQLDWIVTNPPFGLAAEFVAAGLRRARRGVAILARLALFESAGRYPLFFADAPDGPRPSASGPPDPTRPGRAPGLYAIAPFFERVPMTLGRWDPKASTATAYAWFVWLQPRAAADIARRTRRFMGPRPEVWPIAPGTRDRLTKPDDVRRFAKAGAAPLLEGLD